MPEHKKLRLRGFIDPLSLIAIAFMVVTLIIGTSIFTNPDTRLQIVTKAGCCDWMDARLKQAERKAAYEGGDEWEDTKTGKTCVGAACIAIVQNTDNNTKNDVVLPDGTTRISTAHKKRIDEAKKEAEIAQKEQKQTVEETASNYIQSLIKYTGLDSSGNFLEASKVCKAMGGENCNSKEGVKKFTSSVLNNPNYESVIRNQITGNLSGGGLLSQDEILENLNRVIIPLAPPQQPVQQPIEEKVKQSKDVDIPATQNYPLEAERTVNINTVQPQKPPEPELSEVEKEELYESVEELVYDLSYYEQFAPGTTGSLPPALRKFASEATDPTVIKYYENLAQDPTMATSINTLLLDNGSSNFTGCITKFDAERCNLALTEAAQTKDSGVVYYKLQNPERNINEIIDQVALERGRALVSVAIAYVVPQAVPTVINLTSSISTVTAGSIKDLPAAAYLYLTSLIPTWAPPLISTVTATGITAGVGDCIRNGPDSAFCQLAGQTAIVLYTANPVGFSKMMNTGANVWKNTIDNIANATKGGIFVPAANYVADTILINNTAKLLPGGGNVVNMAMNDAGVWVYEMEATTSVISPSTAKVLVPAIPTTIIPPTPTELAPLAVLNNLVNTASSQANTMLFSPGQQTSFMKIGNAVVDVVENWLNGVLNKPELVQPAPQVDAPALKVEPVADVPALKPITIDTPLTRTEKINVEVANIMNKEFDEAGSILQVEIKEKPYSFEIQTFENKDPSNPIRTFWAGTTDTGLFEYKFPEQIGPKSISQNLLPIIKDINIKSVNDAAGIDYRGKGYGTQIVNAFESATKELGLDTIVATNISNKEAFDFWIKQGFEPPLDYRGDGSIPPYAMIKKIQPDLIVSPLVQPNTFTIKTTGLAGWWERSVEAVTESINTGLERFNWLDNTTPNTLSEYPEITLTQMSEFGTTVSYDPGDGVVIFSVPQQYSYTVDIGDKSSIRGVPVRSGDKVLPVQVTNDGNIIVTPLYTQPKLLTKPKQTWTQLVDKIAEIRTIRQQSSGEYMTHPAEVVQSLIDNGHSGYIDTKIISDITQHIPFTEKISDKLEQLRRGILYGDAPTGRLIIKIPKEIGETGLAGWWDNLTKSDSAPTGSAEADIPERVGNWWKRMVYIPTVGVMVYETLVNRDTIINYIYESTKKGYYSPTLNTWIFYDDTSEKWYRVDTNEEVQDDLGLAYMKTSDFRDSDFLDIISGQHLSINQSTFESPEWQNLEKSIKNQTKNNPYNINEITKAVYDNMTYDPAIKVQYSPEGGNIFEEVVVWAVYALSNRSLQNVLNNNLTICFEYAGVEQTYLSKIGIPSQVLFADVDFGDGSGVGNHAFLMITDADGGKWIADPTNNIVESYDDYIKNYKVEKLTITPSIYEFTNPENSPDFTIGIEKTGVVPKVQQFFTDLYKNWRINEIFFQNKPPTLPEVEEGSSLQENTSLQGGGGVNFSNPDPGKVYSHSDAKARQYSPYNIEEKYMGLQFLTDTYNNYNHLTAENIAEVINTSGLASVGTAVDKDNKQIFALFIQAYLKNNGYNNLLQKQDFISWLENETANWYGYTPIIGGVEHEQMTQCVIYQVALDLAFPELNLTNIGEYNFENANDMIKLAENTVESKALSYNYTVNGIKLSDLVNSPDKYSGQEMSFYLDGKPNYGGALFAHKVNSWNKAESGDALVYGGGVGHMVAIIEVKKDEDGNTKSMLVSEANSPKGDLDGTPKTYWIDVSEFELMFAPIDEVVFIRDESYEYYINWFN